jgi:WD40 repeat protein
VLAAAADGMLRVWDAATGRPTLSIDALPTPSDDRRRLAVAFSPDGTRVLSGDQRATAKLWDAAAGKLLQTFQHTSDTLLLQALALAFSPDGKRVLTGGPGDKTAKLWDAASGRLLQTFGEKQPPGHGVAVAFSPDGGRVLTGEAKWSTHVKLWDAASGAPIRTYERPRSFGARLVAFTRDGAVVLASGPSEGVHFWDAASGRLLREDINRRALAVSADGTHALGGPWIVDLSRKGARQLAGNMPEMVTIAVSPDGRLLAGGGAYPRGVSSARLWEPATGKLIWSRNLRHKDGLEAIAAVAFTAEGPRMVSSGGGKLDLWDAATGSHIRKLEKGAHDWRPGYPVVLSPDGVRLATWVGDGWSVWDVPAGRAETVWDLRLPSVATGSAKTIWDARTGRLVREWRDRTYDNARDVTNITALALAPGGAQVLASWFARYGVAAKPMQLWDVATGRLIRTFEEHPSKVHSALFSPDGTRVLTIMRAVTPRARGGLFLLKPIEFETGTELALWDVATGRLLHTLAGHAAGTAAAAFSSDGRRVYSGGLDGTLKVWDAKAGTELATLLATGGEAITVPSERLFVAPATDLLASGEWVTVTPEGFFDASARGAGMLSIVRGLKISAVDADAYQILHRPDLVRAKLAGDPDGKVKAAAAELEAKLQLK